MSLTVERAKEISKGHVTEESLVIHSLNVCYAMGAMAKHFGTSAKTLNTGKPWATYTITTTRNSLKNTCSTPKRNCLRRASPKKTCAPFWHTALKS